jgi:RNA polymerase sigma-70 factor, ECF subfamily
MKLVPGTTHSWEGTTARTMMSAQIHRDPFPGKSVPEGMEGMAGVPRDAADAFARHGDFVWRTLQRLGIRDADLEDVMQEVFVVVGRQLGGFAGSSKVTTWLYGISIRVASTHRRRAWVRREVPTSEMPDGPTAEAGPDDQLEMARERRQLREVLDMMSVEKRALLVMFELDEMSCEEIADVLGVPTGTVHSRLHAAREEFKSALHRWRARSRPPGVSRWSFGRSK